MIVVKHELHQGLKSFCIWTASIAFLVIICILMFPQMKEQMDSATNLFSSMGSFTDAFGMDRLNFGSLIGFYSIECGSILGLGGAFFAALIAISSLAKEEKNHTAEFLLTHPVNRSQVVTEKLVAVIIEIVLMNIIVWVLAAASIVFVGEDIPYKEFNLINVAFLLMQLEIGGICFGISAFVRKGSLGIGIGLATVMYFLKIISNISDSAEFLKYVTPFSFTDGADIITNGCLDSKLILIGALYAVVGIALAYWRYSKKDIH